MMNHSMTAAILGCFCVLLWSQIPVPAQAMSVGVSLDVPTVGTYSVQEDTPEGQIQVCAVANASVQNDAVVTIRTLPFTATSPDDFQSVSQQRTLTPFSGTTRCVDIPIRQDEVVEGTEQFFVSLSSSSSELTVLTSIAFVLIQDGDMVTISLEQDTYTAEEGSPVEVCAVILHGTLARSVRLSIQTADGSASSVMDYVSLSPMLTFDVGASDGSSECRNIPIQDDNIVESTEDFSISLTSIDSVEFENSVGTVLILDDDGASVSLMNTEVSITEGDSGSMPTVPVCVILDSIMDGLDRNVTLKLSTATGTADSNDFVELDNLTLTIPSSTPVGTSTCQSVTILGDDTLESNELFTVTLYPVNPRDSITGSNTSTVTILDDGDVIADCGPLEDPNNGEVQLSAGTLQDSIATYACDQGYNITMGDRARTCQANEQWSGTGPTCEIVDCGLLPSPDNGNIGFTQTVFNSNVSYSCNHGYLLSGPAMRTCQENGTWSGNNPTCEPVDCGTLPSPQNGLVSLPSATTLGFMANYSCNTGYNLIGTATRTCAPEGQWSGSAPTCEIVDCGSLNNPTNAGVHYQPVMTTTFGSQAIYSCNPGYSRSGSGLRSCEASGEWSGNAPICLANCGSLSDPTNGEVSLSGTTEGGVATYRCNSGYVLNGDMTRICQPDRQWSGSMPTCEPVNCGVLSSPVNGHVNTSNGTTFGSQATYSCNEGFFIVGNPIRSCEATGDWSEPEPTCWIVDCGGLVPPSNGNRTLTGTTFGSQANYSCFVGYTLDGAMLRTCTASGSWSESDPMCNIVDCMDPSAPENGVIHAPVTTYESLAVYSCSMGYNLNPGNNFRQCQANGTWSGPNPTCEAVDCGPLDDPTNGQVSLGATTFPSLASYNCSAGYILMGNVTRICQADGEWSDTEPSCEPVDCGELNSPSSGLVNVSSTLLDSQANYSCVEGYRLNGASTRVCETDGMWSPDREPTCDVVDCGSLPSPIKGRIALNPSSKFRGEAIYSCDRGYNLTGMRSRTCAADGFWTGIPPTCQIVQCGGLPNPPNGVVMLNGMVFESRAIYNCSIGYNLFGDVVRSCGPDGEWLGNEPTCEAVICGGLNSPDHGQVSVDDGELGVQANYTCDNGYTRVGNPFRVCQANATWSGAVPVCEIVDCGDPPTLLNGNANFTDTVFGSLAMYTCLTGYNITGDITRTCLANGTWTDSASFCELLQCVDLEDPVNGNVIFSSSLLGSQANYSCDEGFNLIGGNVRTCQANELWSGSEPTCEDVNECLDGNGGCEQVCRNSPGSHHCECTTGYRLVDDFNCADVDECATNLLVCHRDATCNNTLGGFHCSCNEGYTGDGSTCTNVDECVEGLDDCDVNALCTDTVGSFTCDCLDGFVGNGITCAAQCRMPIQLYLSEINECSDWRFEQTNEKLTDIRREVVSILNDRCQCSLPESHITLEEFDCTSNDIEVIFRAQLRGMLDDDCDELRTHISEWVEEGSASFRVQGNRLVVTASCTVGNENSEDAVGCSRPTGTTPTSVGTLAEQIDPVVIGAAAGGGTVVILFVIIFIVVVIVCVRRRRAGKRKQAILDTDQNVYNTLKYDLANSSGRSSTRSRDNTYHDVFPMNDIPSVENVPSVNTFNPAGDVIPTLIRAHSNRSQHRTFIGGVNSDDRKEKYDQDSGDEFYETIGGDDFEEIYEKINESQVANNPLYTAVQLAQ